MTSSNEKPKFDLTPNIGGKISIILILSFFASLVCYASGAPLFILICFLVGGIISYLLLYRARKIELYETGFKIAGVLKSIESDLHSYELVDQVKFVYEKGGHILIFRYKTGTEIIDKSISFPGFVPEAEIKYLHSKGVRIIVVPAGRINLE